MSWWILYLRIGCVWMVGVSIARVIDGGWGSSPLVWVPATAFLWPLSMAHSVYNFVRGLLGG